MTASLSSDVLLLALGERANYLTNGPVQPVLAGALLCEELLAGRPLPPMAAARTYQGQLLAELPRLGRVALSRAAEPLLHDGTIQPYTYRLLKVFSRDGFRVTDRAALLAARQRLQSALTPGPDPTPAHAVLGQLCALSGIAVQVLTPPADRRTRAAYAQRLNQLAHLAGPQIGEVLLATRRLYAHERVDSVFVPVDGSTTYGDGGHHGAHDGGGHHGGGHDGGGGGHGGH